MNTDMILDEHDAFIDNLLYDYDQPTNHFIRDHCKKFNFFQDRILLCGGCMDDRQFEKLLAYLNLSWKGYRKVRKGVKKRISRHMLALKCDNMDDYIKQLKSDERMVCKRLMSVSISRFFRDPVLWTILEEKILPSLYEKDLVSVWSAGCACGEEVYSIRILQDLIEKAQNKSLHLRIVATDIHPEYIGKAQTGIYTSSSLREINDDLREQYFTKRKKQYQIKNYLKKGITWEVRPFEKVPSDQMFDVIFLRNNLLTYYLDHERGQILQTIISSLAPSGWFIIGSKEKLPHNCISLLQMSGCSCIFRKF